MNIKYGLSDVQVIQSRKKYGKNVISGKNSDGFFKLFISSFGDPIIKILLIALGIKLLFLFKNFDWYETIGIVIAIFIASFISTISEYGSEKAFNKLQEESSKVMCRVKRNGIVSLIGIDDVVVGDVVLLETGDKIPADGVIVSGKLSVDESSINGESKEVYKYSSDVNISSSSVFRGTVVFSGVALMVVKKVGNDTFYGEIARELQVKQPDSPLKLRLASLATSISKLGYIGAFLVSFSYLFNVIVIDNGFNIELIVDTISNFHLMFGHFLYALTLTVTVIVVAVPEGLPMMITLVLSSNMRRMIKSNVMVRKMTGIETAGNINILFTDKTGTLTRGKLDVIGFMSGSLREFNKFDDLLRFDRFCNVVRLSCLYNNASTYSDGNVIGGNITDRAILSFVNSPYSNDIRVISSIPFDSKIKYSSTYISDGYRRYNFIKGACEVVLKRCSRFLCESGDVKSFFNRKSIDNIVKLKASNGIRVLAMAYSENDNLDDLIFLGLVFIKDEVRDDALSGIELVKNAHIQTVMITGDNKDTAISIGREVGILTSDDEIVLSSDQLSSMSDDDVKLILPKLRIVARSLPRDKSRLVRISQELGLVVGMTGDGVNDAPALKNADVGFAMGSGTEVAREASDIIILDDNFMSISKAILFGRTIFKSIRKFIIFQLTVNICAVSLSVVGPFIGIETPVTVIQMLWINMVMDTFAGIAFSYEPPLIEYMDEYPKRKNEPIVNSYMKNEIVFTGVYSSLLCILFLKLPFISNIFRDGVNNKYLMSAFFGLFIFIGIFNSFNARTSRINVFANLFKNKVFLFVICFIAFVQVLLIYYGGDLFRTVGLNFREFLFMILFSLSVIPFDWIRKYFVKKKGINYGV
jgi:calcium-translocating P-type ATPase